MQEVYWSRWFRSTLYGASLSTDFTPSLPKNWANDESWLGEYWLGEYWQLSFAFGLFTCYKV